MICLDLDVAAIRARRRDLASDRCLAARVAAYRRLAAERGLNALSTAAPVEQVRSRIERMVGV